MYALTETVFTLPYGPTDARPLQTTTYAFTILAQQNTILTQLNYPSLLSAIYLPSSGPRLYYFTQDTSGRYYIWEIAREQVPGQYIAAPKFLTATARDLGAPLAAVVAESYPDSSNGLQEINVFFVDDKNYPSRLMFNRDSGWYRGRCFRHNCWSLS